MVEQREVPDLARGLELVRAVDAELRRQVLVYGNARNGRILGSPLLVRVANGAWSDLMAAQVRGKNANDTQHKQQPLVADLGFVSRLPVVDLHDSEEVPQRQAA